MSIVNRLVQSQNSVLRTIALHINALFPFVLTLKDYINGRILRGLCMYIRDWSCYNREERRAKSGFNIVWLDNFPCLLDRFESAGSLSKHYFYQDLWAATKVHDFKVSRHYDIGSRLDGFIAHCLPFCEVVMLDVRPLPYKINNLIFQQVNCMNMDQIPSGSILSISTLHAIEHFGLGRYGDPIDPLGHKKAIDEIKRVVAVGGQIVFSVPIGVQRLEFNGHRIFDPKTIVDLFESCDLQEFSVVDDRNELHENVRVDDWRNLRYGCGLFLFKKCDL